MQNQMGLFIVNFAKKTNLVKPQWCASNAKWRTVIAVVKLVIRAVGLWRSTHWFLPQAPNLPASRRLWNAVATAKKTSVCTACFAVFLCAMCAWNGDSILDTKSRLWVRCLRSKRYESRKCAFIFQSNNLTLHLKVHFIYFVKEWTNDSRNYTCNLAFIFARFLIKKLF